MSLDNIDGTWTAIVFLLVGLVLIFIETLAPGFFIAVPGGALTFMGAIGLIAPNLMFHSRVSWALWPMAGIVSALINVYAYKRWAPAGHAPLTLSKDSLAGQDAVVLKPIDATLDGKVRIRGQEWSARTEGGLVIPPGAHVTVLRSEGVHVVVAPK